MIRPPPPSRPASFVLRLERIGDDRVAVHRRNGSLRTEMDLLRRGGGAPWVADITEGRTFLAPLRDYAQANGRGSRGIYDTFILRPGRVYEVNEITGWTSHRRYRCRVVAGRLEEL